MHRLDDLLIDRIFSPLAGRLQRGLGLCPRTAALECLNGSIVFYLAGTALEIAAKGPADGIFATMLRALLWLMIFDGLRRIGLRQAASPVGVRTARAREWIFRLALAAMLPISLCFALGWPNLAYSASLLLLTCHLYLKASDAPPPEPRGRLAPGRA